jgi:hypothetical protein
MSSVEMTQLILKRASASRPSGQWSDKDYDVLADGKVVGRIYEDAHLSTPPDMRWVWSITAIVPATPGVTNGHAPTLDEAKIRFRAAWERAKARATRRALLLKVPHHERLGPRDRDRLTSPSAVLKSAM